jgi:hypothetical protein
MSPTLVPADQDFAAAGRLTFQSSLETFMRKTLIIAAGTIFATIPVHAQQSDWQAGAVERAIDHHLEKVPEACVVPERSGLEPAYFELQIGEDTAARQALLVEFPCQIGAYNQTAVYLLSDQHGVVSEVIFPSPQVEVRYADEADPTTVEEIVLTEIPDMREVVNPAYDSSSRTMTERNKWRGAGDAYSTTQWGFKNGKFEITLFAVDASFDGADNPQTLIRNEIW